MTVKSGRVGVKSCEDCHREVGRGTTYPDVGNTKVTACTIITVLLVLSAIQSTEAKNYCSSMRIICPSDHVISVNFAEYGRMEINRCATTNYGNIGCGDNVKPFLSRYCNGRNSCDILNLETMFSDVRQFKGEFKVGSTTCPQSDLKSYLDANHSCIKTAKWTCQRGFSKLAVSSTISSHLGGNCPWRLAAGRTAVLSISVNIRLQINRNKSDSSLTVKAEECRYYITLRSGGPRSTPRTISLCGGEEGQGRRLETIRNGQGDGDEIGDVTSNGVSRELGDSFRVITQSNSKSPQRGPIRPVIRISLSNRDTWMTYSPELLKSTSPIVVTALYNVTGCLPYEVFPEDAVFADKRDQSTTVLRCSTTDMLTSTLTCDPTTGIWRGQKINCTRGEISREEFQILSIHVLAVACIASLVCLSILIVGFFCLRRIRNNQLLLEQQHREQAEQHQHNQQSIRCQSLPRTDYYQRHPCTMQRPCDHKTKESQYELGKERVNYREDTAIQALDLTQCSAPTGEPGFSTFKPQTLQTIATNTSVEHNCPAEPHYFDIQPTNRSNVYH